MQRKPRIVKLEKVPKTYWREVEKRIQKGTASEEDLTSYRHQEAHYRMRQRPDGHLGWLVEFLGRDLEDLREGEWADLGFDVLAFRTGEEAAYMTVAHIDTEGVNREVIRKVQAEIKACLEELKRDGRWQVSYPGVTWIFYMDPQTRSPKKQYSAHFPEAFFLGAMDLFMEHWDRLRRCLYCQKPFLASGRKVYCSPRCSQQARWEQFKKKHPKRQRDYRAERQRRKERTA